MKTLKAKSGDILTFDCLEWFHEGWEFGHPVILLSPVVWIAHDHNADVLIEKVAIDLACEFELPKISENDIKEMAWRGWNLKYLRSVFKKTLCGHKFPKAHYSAKQKKIKFFQDKDFLSFEEV